MRLQKDGRIKKYIHKQEYRDSNRQDASFKQQRWIYEKKCISSAIIPNTLACACFDYHPYVNLIFSYFNTSLLKSMKSEQQYKYQFMDTSLPNWEQTDKIVCKTRKIFPF